MSQETSFLRLEIKGRLPLLFPASVAKWQDDGMVLVITCEDTFEPRESTSLGYKQFTVYHVPWANIKYFGPHVVRAASHLGLAL